jgi:GntR family transcriptional repressor for pyruvate dehydrogenase complex
MHFKPIKPRKIYEQIVEQIKGMITEGNIKPGDKLPSEREMANKLKVSRASALAPVLLPHHRS